MNTTNTLVTTNGLVISLDGESSADITLWDTEIQRDGNLAMITLPNEDIVKVDLESSASMANLINKYISVITTEVGDLADKLMEWRTAIPSDIITSHMMMLIKARLRVSGHGMKVLKGELPL